MPDQRIETTQAIEALLDEAAEAHHVYERDALNGVYDQQWPAWYAAYVVDRGLGKLVGRDLSAWAVGEQLARASDEFRALDPQPAETWSAWTARRIALEG
jgi:hypothetical protein